MNNDPFRMNGVEIFRVGSYPQGLITESDLDQITASYDPAYHEAPVKFDHQEQGKALGWVERLYRIGSSLFADLKEVSQELIDAVKRGEFKKRSIEIFKDLDGRGPYLKAVALLGASIPQVKGMKEIRMSNVEGPKSNVQCPTSDVRGHSTFNVQCSTLDEGLRVPDEDSSRVTTQKGGEEESIEFSLVQEGTSEPLVAEGELFPALRKLKIKIRSLIDSLALQEEELRKAQKRIEEQETERKSRLNEVFFQEMLRDGKITPLFKKMGGVELLNSLDETNVLKFGEKGEQQFSQAELLKEIIRKGGLSIPTGEVFSESLSGRDEMHHFGQRDNVPDSPLRMPAHPGERQISASSVDFDRRVKRWLASHPGRSLEEAQIEVSKMEAVI